MACIETPEAAARRRALGVFSADEILARPSPTKAELEAERIADAAVLAKWKAEREAERATWTQTDWAAFEAAEIEAERAALERGPIGAWVLRERALNPRHRLMQSDDFEGNDDE